MLNIIALTAIAIVVAIATFIGCVLFMDKQRWWRDAELGALIPYFIIATPVSIFAASVVIWTITRFM